ncbi:MAG: META domain-containing protein [Chryseobacterium sp.]|nr:MAG: META domain-containing protein [Chryseobacterium sp.]
MKKIVFGLGVFAVTACGSLAPTAKIGGPQNSLSNTKWEVVDSYNTNARPYISFDPEQGMTGNGGCNRIFSNNVVISSKDGSFHVNAIASTRMACPSMDMSTESNFIKMIESADHYVTRKDMLELYKGNMLLMKLRKAQ